jgi:hypothetical protein
MSGDKVRSTVPSLNITKSPPFIIYKLLQSPHPKKERKLSGKF